MNRTDIISVLALVYRSILYRVFTLDYSSWLNNDFNLTSLQFSQATQTNEKIDKGNCSVDINS